MNRYQRLQQQKKEDRQVWLAVLACWLLASAYFVLVAVRYLELRTLI